MVNKAFTKSIHFFVAKASAGWENGKLLAEVHIDVRRLGKAKLEGKEILDGYHGS